jgi:hypothetical protein
MPSISWSLLVLVFAAGAAAGAVAAVAAIVLWAVRRDLDASTPRSYRES